MYSWTGKILNDKYRIGTELKDIEITDKPLVVLCYGKIINEKDKNLVFTNRPKGRKDYQLFYIKRGEFNFVIDGINTVYGENTLILIKPGTPQIRYALSENQRCTHLFVHFSGSDVENLLNKYNINRTVINLDGKFEAFEDTINRMEAGKSGNYHENLCNILLEELFILISNNAKKPLVPKKKGFNELLRIMNETCTENHPIKYYADLIHFSEVYFVRFFKKAMHQSPHKYLMNLKMQKAVNLLVHTNDPIKIVAEKLGFLNQHYFSKVFYDYYKTTPTEYRNLGEAKKQK